MELTSTLCFLLLAVGSFHYSSAQTTDYCDPVLCYGYVGVHVGCNATAQFPATCSANRRIVTMTDTYRQYLVRTHNQHRNAIAAGIGSLQPAARMATMQWDTELAHLAELRAYTCTNTHDKCRGTTNFLFAGQNNALTTFNHVILNNINVTNILITHTNFWFNQYQSATMDGILAYSKDAPIIGAFTAMAQEKANRIGCAMLQNINDGRAQHVTTCNYSYINVVGRPVYTPGTVGSQCVTGRNTNFPNLCTVNEEYAVNEVPGHDGVTTKVKIN